MHKETASLLERFLICQSVVCLKSVGLSVQCQAVVIMFVRVTNMLSDRLLIWQLNTIRLLFPS